MDKVKLEIVGLSYSQTQSGAYALVLAEVGGKRSLPIIIGGFEAQAIAIELEKMTPLQVDEMIEKAGKAKDKTEIVFASRADYHFELGNATLILELDENIIQHFVQNKAAFERMKDAALTELAGKEKNGDRSFKLADNMKTDYRKLFISSISYGGYQLGGNCLDFLIGGMLDNTVGYLYVTDKKDLPEMSDARVIMLREIADGWYLYKTT